MAPQDTTYSKVETFEWTVLTEGFKGILGTGRGETAGRTSFQRGETDLIEAYKKDKRSDGHLFQNSLDPFIFIIMQ